MLHTDERTIANLFADNGYVTGMAGKWHLGDNAPHRPQDRGFQDVVWHRCGGIGQASDYWGNDYFDDTYERVNPGSRVGSFESFTGYCTDVFFAEGLRFIEENKEKPFFLYLSLNAPHGPYRVPPEWAAPYQGVKEVNNPNFYGMIANIDHNIGVFRQRLSELGLTENTILIFMTDNGTAAGAKFEGLESEAISGFNAGMRGKKSSIYEGGHRVPFFIYWPKGGLTGGKDIDTLTAHVDVLPTLAELCGISASDAYHPDGSSLVPLLQDESATWQRDHLLIQFHGGAYGRSPLDVPFNDSVVLTEQWRLVNSGKQELHRIQDDPAQRHDVSAEYPAEVARLRSLYAPFWKSVSPRLVHPARIDLGNPNHNPTELCSQDWYMKSGYPPWHFGVIRKLPRVTAPWLVDVKQAGRYRFTLRQWPETAQKHVVAVRAKVKIAGQEKECVVERNSKGVIIELSLPAGPTELWTFLYDENGKAGGAYFTSVEAIAKATSPAVSSANLYVSPSGSDANPGSQKEPVATLARARDLVRPLAGQESVTVHVADGIYYLPDTITYVPKDSGTADAKITYRAENEGGAVLSGGSKLNLRWKPFRDGILQAETPAGLKIDQLFVDGKNQRMARYPNYDPAQKSAPYQGYAADAFSTERAASWANPVGGYIHAIHRASWGGYHYLITGKDAQGDVTYEGGWQNNRQMGMHKDFRMVENIFEELDAPGEWFHNAATGTLFYKPASGVDLSKAKVEVVRLRHLVEFIGSKESPVKFITMQGFVVRHAARTFMDTKEQMLRSDWAIYRGGAFLLTGTEDVQILDTEFDQVGGNAVFVSNYNRHVLVKGCHIHDTGASGVCFVGNPDAVRDPLFEYSQKNDLATIDRTIGPKSGNYPSQSGVADCLIHGIGRVERQPAGVQIEMAQEITVRDVSVYDCARAGINIGDGAWGGHLIERCDVFDTVLETHDHGSFNSWGRDRYWRSDQQASQAAVDAEPNLPFLDAMKTTTIRDSRWRCDHGWDIDLDDGSSNYDIYNNLLLGKGLKLREGFRRHAWNNVIPFGSLHPHVWYDKSKDQVSRNIFSSNHRPARMNRPYVDETMVDRNFFNMPDGRAITAAAKLGWDRNSVSGDPMFVDPQNGDFRVKDDSPALALGFKNFPMDQFGVKKPALKAIAQTPSIPERKSGTQLSNAGAPTNTIGSYWLGAKLNDLTGQQFSAYGIRQEDGGVALSGVAGDSAAAVAGLKEGDLIQTVNAQKIKTVADLLTLLGRFGDAPLKLKVIRNQAVIQLTPSPTWFVLVESDELGNFSKLQIPASSGQTVTANQKVNDNPLSSLCDGKLSAGYGPVFGNGVRNGAYKLDLGKVEQVSAITSWSHNMGQTRGVQRATLYASPSPTDPGWDLSVFTPLGTIDTTRIPSERFNAASLRAPAGRTLGSFRWIVWSVAPVSPRGGGENSAFQEFAVELAVKGSAAPSQ